MRRTFVPGLALGAMLVAVGLLLAQTKPSVRRARPPKFEPDVSGIFSGDARDLLKGERPKPGSSATSSGSVANPVGSANESPQSGGGKGWSKIVSADVLEAEVKRLSAKVSQDVTTPSNYAGGGYKRGRRHFTTLAAVFGVIAEYDGNVRWKREAPGLRDQFARAASNSKVGSQAAYNEAAQRKTELEEMIRGSSPNVPDAEPSVPWKKVVDRPPLMNRLEQSFLNQLKGWTSSAGEFKTHSADAAHEAQIIALLAEILTRDNMPDHDDEEYARMARDMKAAALEIADAARNGGYDKASTAAGTISKSCSDCHDGYR